MPHYTYRNVNHAFNGLVKQVLDRTIETKRSRSRNGDVLRFPGPVIITYKKPTERVLFNQVRDCNPFFHLYESLWMLAGRNDVAALERYTSQMRKFSDNGSTFHGAYGYRWRQQMGFDQLKLIAEILQKLPYDRRCVLQMWDSRNFTGGMSGDFTQLGDLIVGSRGGLDVPCNLSAVFEIDHFSKKPKLDMTVYNRSNDMILGMFGANVVHFSILHEFMAKWIGVGVGRYNQITCNLHIYLDNWKGPEYLQPSPHQTMRSGEPDYTGYSEGEIMPLVQNAERFDQECQAFVENEEALCTEPFLVDVAQPMCLAFRHHKERDYSKAYEALSRVQSADWRWVALQWIEKRESAWRAGNVKAKREAHSRG